MFARARGGFETDRADSEVNVIKDGREEAIAHLDALWARSAHHGLRAICHPQNGLCQLRDSAPVGATKHTLE
jgi:hypothetical protein